jgi:hypothetical protein
MDVQSGRTKNARIEMRVTERDREMILKMAFEARMSVSDFILSRVWGEVSEAENQVPAQPPATGISELKSRLGLKTASELASNPESQKPVKQVISVICPNCKGRKQGFHEISQEWIDCPRCNGEGRISA